MERNTNRRRFADWRAFESLCDFPLLNDKCCCLKLESQTHACRWICDASNFSPVGPSVFSISGELEDKCVLAVDQKASRERTGRSEVVLIHYKKQVS